MTQKKLKSYYFLTPSQRARFEETVRLTVPNDVSNQNNEKFIRTEKPDGGWGWLVVLGVAISNMTTQSLISVFGLLFIQRFSDLDITTKGASVIMGMQTTCLNLSGLIIGPVIKKYSYRKTAVMGALLVFGGLLLTRHADSLLKFVFSYSLFTGVGLGLLNPSTFVAINSYFSSRRGRAVGFSATGTGIGQMLLPFIVEYLLKEYGFKGTILILSGLSLHAFLGATLYQPVKWHMRAYYVPRDPEISDEEDLKPKETTSLKISTETTREESLLSKLSQAMNVDLMKNASFVNLLIGLALAYVGNMCFSMLLPFFLQSIHYSRPNIALCMSVLSGSDILGRIIVPTFTDVFKIRSKTIFFVGAALSALARSALVWQKNLGAILFFASLAGIVRAALVCNFNLSISEQTIAEKLPSALGLHMLFKGLAILIFAPVIGFIRDYTKSYAFSLHILNVFFLALPFAAWLIEFLYSKKK